MKRALLHLVLLSAAGMMLDFRGPPPLPLAVTSVQPANASIGAAVNAQISVTFDRAVDPATVNSTTFRAFAHASGAVSGPFSFSNGNQTVTLTPSTPFSPGEPVTVNLSHNIKDTAGVAMRQAGYAFRFWARARHACANFGTLDTFTNRLNAGDITRIYGSLAVDLNHDGWIDLATINEDSADIRVFPNSANGSGLFNPWLQPPTVTLTGTSPHQPGDFNNDGKIDVCEASYFQNKMTVVLGNGNGTFQPQATKPIGTEPAGIAVLDVDGDADPDIVTANHVSNNLSLLLNNGLGGFGNATPIATAGNGEYALASADMNNDGVFDLVVGCFDGQQVVILLGNGNGTFTALPPKPSGGNCWQIGAADVNGDGKEDVHVANSFFNNGAILLNAGGGVLGAPTTYGTGSDAVATDMGDVDGDGDLDWCLSYFSSASFTLLLNNGAGAFTEADEFASPQAGSCASFLDFDNDGDLDLALADELADVIITQRNNHLAADVNCDGLVNIDDLFDVINAWGPCPASGGCDADISPAGISGDHEVDIDDLFDVINHWT